MIKTGTTPLCHSHEIPEGQSRGLNYKGEGLILIKKQGQLYCYLNRCPHVGLPLEWQEHQFLSPDGSLIQCSSHGALFEIDSGSCVAGPCPGQALQKRPLFIENGSVYIATD